MPTTMPAVGVALVARILAHAVGHHAARLRGGGHHGAARAHAEAVGRAAVGAVVHQLVVGRAEQRVPACGAEAGAVDQRLRVFDAEADRERLGFDMTPRSNSIWKVSRALWPTASTTWSGAISSPPASQDATDLAAVRSRSELLDLAAEADLAAQRSISARMFSTMLTQRKVPMCGLADVEDFLGRAGLDELGQHLAAVVLGSLIWL
jgi:hypothetical protein